VVVLWRVGCDFRSGLQMQRATVKLSFVRDIGFHHLCSRKMQFTPIFPHRQYGAVEAGSAPELLVSEYLLMRMHELFLQEYKRR
jgi:hypothetical protein